MLIVAHSPLAFAKVIVKGLEYDQYISESKQIIHVLIINPKEVILKPIHANDKVQGLETVASLARQENAIAAINGSFFRMGEKVDGLPAGILKIAGRWFGVAYGSRGAIGWSIVNQEKENQSNVAQSSQGLNEVSQESRSDSYRPAIKVLMDRVQTKTSLEMNGYKFPVHGVNQPGTLSKSILYTDAYGRKPDSVEGGTDIIIQNGQIQAIVPAGESTIPLGGFVYAIGPKAKRLNTPLAVGAVAKVQIKVNPTFKKNDSEDWQRVDHIVGGIPLLMENGRILQDYSQERMQASFTHQQHARTAIGILSSGHWILAVVEKSQATGSPGMSLPELSSFLQKLGCYTALNLDGGGSSTLYLEGKVINNPENELEDTICLPIARRIGDAILVLPRGETTQ